MPKRSIHLPRSLIYVLVTLAILLPTIFAVITVMYIDSGGSVELTRASEVVLYDDSGNELYREHESMNLSGDGSLIGIFNTMYGGIQQVDKIPDEIAAVKPLTVHITDNSGTHKLKCHFPLDNMAYCTDETDTHYKIRPADSKRFLVSEFAQSLYPSSAVPVMSTSDGETVLPQSSSWHYKNIDNDYILSSNAKYSEDVITYSMTGGISLSFSETPDYTDADVYEGGELVFSGSIYDLEDVTLDMGENISIHLTARWRRSEQCEHYGTLKYEFNVDIHSRAQFSLNKTSFGSGEFVTLTATNIYDLSRLKFTAADNSFTPKMLLSDTTAYMLIPHSVCKESTSFDFTVSYGISSAEFSIASGDADDALTDKNIAASAQALNMDPSVLPADGAPHIFHTAATVLPDNKLYSKTNSYGTSIVHGNEELTSFFTEYTCSQHGMSVKALIGGKIIYSGENQHFGKYAVCDLGAGLRIWYCNLSVIDVSEGDYLAAGDIVGKSGTLLDEENEGFTLILTCQDQILNAEYLLSEKSE